MQRPVMGVLLLALVLGSAVAGWWALSEEEVERGDVVDLAGDVGAGDAEVSYALDRTVELRIPTGAVRVRVGVPVAELDDGTHAAEGAVLLPLQWELEPWFVQIPGTSGDEVEPYRLSVEPAGGGERVELDSTPRAVAVAVPRREARDATIAITFAGLTQTAGPDGEVDAGVAEALYETDPPSAPPAVVDGLTTDTAGTLPAGVDLSGRVTAVAVHEGPWVPADGWVNEPGQSWCSVDVTTLLPPVVPGPSGAYRVRDAGPDVRLDDVEPASSLLRTEPGGPVSSTIGSGLRTWLLGNGAGRLEVRHEVTLVPRRGGDRVAVTLFASIPADAVCPRRADPDAQ